jgi:hypothetical protein
LGTRNPLLGMDPKLFVTELTSAFRQEHRGFKLKEAATQSIEVGGLRVVLNSGALLWNSREASYAEAGDLNLDKLVRSLFILGIDREMVTHHMGTWASTLSLYNPPRIYFRPAEQRLLRSALKGLTDGELSNELGVSLAFVKKTWHSIYERAAEAVPDLHLDKTDASASHRGKEKKQ